PNDLSQRILGAWRRAVKSPPIIFGPPRPPVQRIAARAPSPTSPRWSEGAGGRSESCPPDRPWRKGGQWGRRRGHFFWHFPSLLPVPVGKMRLLVRLCLRMWAATRTSPRRARPDERASGASPGPGAPGPSKLIWPGFQGQGSPPWSADPDSGIAGSDTGAFLPSGVLPTVLPG